MGRIAAAHDPDDVLDRTRREANGLFDATASILSPGQRGMDEAVVLPLRIRGEAIGSLQLVRAHPLDREELARATLLADFTCRAVENARLLDEAQVREAERARLSDQLITAEQEERRRLALFLHDGPVQSLSGISLMLDAVIDSLEGGRLEEATSVLDSALQRHRDTIRSLRDLSFNIEPVVLRDQGFEPAVRALADQVGLEQAVRIELDVEAGNRLGEQVQVGLYQIIRESLTQAIRRGPPTSISVRLGEVDGNLELVIEDDGSGERRKASLDSLGERAATLNARFSVEQPPEGGTRVHVVLPAYAAGAGGE